MHSKHSFCKLLYLLTRENNAKLVVKENESQINLLSIVVGDKADLWELMTE